MELIETDLYQQKILNPVCTDSLSSTYLKVWLSKHFHRCLRLPAKCEEATVIDAWSEVVPMDMQQVLHKGDDVHEEA